MQRRRATLNDIARKAGVTRSTVSLALNGKGRLSQERREEIKRIAEELNYVPHPLAQALRGKQSKFIGIVINYFSNIFFREFYAGLEEVADTRGFSFMISQTCQSVEKERAQVARFIEHGADGIIVMPCSQERAHLDRAAACRVPVVLLSNHLGDAFPAVVSDNVHGAELATRYLLSLAGRQVVHITGPQDQSCLRDRCEAFCRVLAEERPGLNIDERIFILKTLQSADAYRLMDAVMGRHAPPLGIFVCNAEIAMGVLQYCREKGLRIPGDVAVSCFAGHATFNTLPFPVTAVASNAKEMGAAAAAALLERIENPSKPHEPTRIVFPVTLRTYD